MAKKVERKQCAAMTTKRAKFGSHFGRCQRWAKKGSKYCSIHAK